MGNFPHVPWQGYIVRVAPVITPPIALLVTDVDVCTRSALATVHRLVLQLLISCDHELCLRV
jgi:hypothetical protein